MGEQTLTLSDGDVEVEVSFELLYNELGDQYILGDPERPEFGYLAALAIECYDDEDTDIEDVLMEFIYNSGDVDTTLEESSVIEEILRG